MLESTSEPFAIGKRHVSSNSVRKHRHWDSIHLIIWKPHSLDPWLWWIPKRRGGGARQAFKSGLSDKVGPIILVFFLQHCCPIAHVFSLFSYLLLCIKDKASSSSSMVLVNSGLLTSKLRSPSPVMLASARSSILAIFILIPLLYIISVSHAPLQGLKIFSKPAANHSSTFSDEPEVVFDENPRGAPRIRQASMVFGDREDAVFERSLRTHFRHGSRWGYPTHILRQDALGNKDFSKLVYNKILYLQTLVVKEMIKSPEQRSEWIV